MPDTHVKSREGESGEPNPAGRIETCGEPPEGGTTNPGLPEGGTTSLGTPRSPRYETLTAWRGVACLLVVIYHSLFTGHGLAFPNGAGPLETVLAIAHRFWVGVPLFFVISGYCVTASADNARTRIHAGRHFFWRRFHRIYPVYWAWLGVAALGIYLVERTAPGFFTSVFVPNPTSLTFWQWCGNLTLTETWRWHLTGGVETHLLSPAWTLCYEEQFYALVGIALLLARGWFFQFLAGITVAVTVGVLVLPSLGLNTRGLFLDGQWFMFAAGVLVYYVVNYGSKWVRAAAYVLFSIGIIYAVAEPRHLLHPRVNEPNQSYLAAFLFAALLLSLHRRDPALSRTPWLRPLRFCGEMCYSLYLVHWPVVTVVGWAFNQLGFSNPWIILIGGLCACLAVAISLARLFHHLIERRFWNPGYR